MITIQEAMNIAKKSIKIYTDTAGEIDDRYIFAIDYGVDSMDPAGPEEYAISVNKTDGSLSYMGFLDYVALFDNYTVMRVNIETGERRKLG